MRWKQRLPIISFFHGIYPVLEQVEQDIMTHRTSCARGDTICPRPSPPPVGAQAPRAPSSRHNVAVVSHAEYVPTLTDDLTRY